MSYTQFNEDTEAFQAWMNENPKGFVLNVFIENNRRTRIHKAGCRHLKQIGVFHPKVCATEPASLIAWNGTNPKSINLDIPYCRSCLPRGYDEALGTRRGIAPRRFKDAETRGTLRHFQRDEAGYADWLRTHPNGFVLNFRDPPLRHRLMLHRATCGTIRSASPNIDQSPFTGGKYSKVCSNDPSDIEEWLISRVPGVDGYTHLCGICSPDAPPPTTVEGELVERELDRRVKRALADSTEARQRRLELAAPDAKPLTSSYVLTRMFDRDPDVIAEVLSNAKGHCQNCNMPAPFLSKARQRPYLEVHHRIRLADGGLDIVANAIALCPNCHRQMHHG